MDNYKLRLKEEAKELELKLNKLIYFLDTDNSKGADELQIELLKVQSKVMNSYLHILKSRIKLIK